MNQNDSEILNSPLRSCFTYTFTTISISLNQTSISISLWTRIVLSSLPRPSSIYTFTGSLRFASICISIWTKTVLNSPPRPHYLHLYQHQSMNQVSLYQYQSMNENGPQFTPKTTFHYSFASFLPCAALTRGLVSFHLNSDGDCTQLN